MKIVALAGGVEGAVAGVWARTEAEKAMAMMLTISFEFMDVS